MKLGMIGLGRMGGNMARRLARAGIEVTAFDASADTRSAVAQEPGITAAADLAALVTALPTPRVVWIMLPAGAITEQTLTTLTTLLSPGDVVVDGGNANYRDSMRRAALLSQNDLHFVDAGVSGGVWGLENGYAIMYGGAPEAARIVEPLIRALAPAPDKGWLHCGPAGSGHFVKMVHNGIEYGMMQAMAEGFALMEAKREFDLDLGGIAEMWRHGSVVRSWLLDLTADFLRHDQKLEAIRPVVADSGEGRWTATEAIELGVPTPVMTLALLARFSSQGHDDYGSKLLAMMRAGFGGHPVQHGS
ncbi:MAG: decarboxylating 6-phosphogluconate dehydrogenase [Burkholderiales bacterium]|nr:decarboxylating 6-phosphogluconate dehydrogenase [Burkholderiales bacterium]